MLAELPEYGKQDETGEPPSLGDKRNGSAKTSPKTKSHRKSLQRPVVGVAAPGLVRLEVDLDLLGWPRQDGKTDRSGPARFPDALLLS